MLLTIPIPIPIQLKKPNTNTLTILLVNSGGDGSYVLLAAVGADDGAGGRQDASASIRSSPYGQDEAVDTPAMAVGRQEGPNSVEFRVTLFHFYID